MLVSHKRVAILSGAVCYSKLANFKDVLWNVEFLEPTGRLKFLRNLDGVKYFDERESI